MDSRSRQDALIRCLRRRGMVGVDALAAELGVSRRTILRDVAALRDQGFVIDSEAGRGGGLRLDPHSIQTASRLTVPEVFALLVSVASMRAAGVMPFGGLADAGLAKIEKALSREKVADLRQMLDCLHVGHLSPAQDLSDLGPMDPALLPAFEMAFLQGVCLRFRYRDKAGRKTCRRVEPQALLVLPPLWYLVAYDPARADFRHFRMDRVTAPEILHDVPFRRRHVPFEADICPFAAWSLQR